MKRLFPILVVLISLLVWSALVPRPVADPPELLHAPGAPSASRGTSLLPSPVEEPAARGTSAASGPLRDQEVLVLRDTEDGRMPIAAADVSWISENAGRRVRAESDAEGRAILKGVSPGRASLRVLAAGFLGVERTMRGELGGERVEIVLASYSRAGGRVQDQAGHPIEGARCRVEVARYFGRKMSLVHPADRDDLASLDLLTDADGRGELRILPPETEVQVQIFHPAFLPAAVLLPRLSFGERHEFIAVLSKAGSITGEILAPMPGAEKARVELVRAFPGGGSERVGVVEMEEKRRFRFDGVPPGPVRLQYSRRSQDLIEVGIAEALALEGQNVDVGTIPVEGGSARLLVADPEGWVEDGRLADVSLRIHFLPYETPQRMLSLTWTLTIDREVEVRGIPRAALQASASVRKQNGEGSDRRFVQTSLQVPDFEATDGRVVLPIERMPAMGAVELLLQPPSSLEGTQLRAWAFATRGGEVARTIFRPMPADQPLELDRLRVGEHRVVVMADRFVSDHLVVDVREDETSTVTVKRWRPARSLVGETVDESGEPVPKAELTLFLSGETRLRKVFSVYSDTAGRFEILALPPGEGYFLGDDRRKEHLSSLEAILKDPAGRVVVERR